MAKASSAEAQRATSTASPSSPRARPSPAHAVLSDPALLGNILSFLPGQDLLSVRQVNTTLKAAADASARDVVPYPDAQRFGLANHDRIPDVFPARKPVTKKEAIHAGFQMYDRAAKGGGPAQLERLDDKDTLFGAKGSAARAVHTGNGSVFDPPVSVVPGPNQGKGVWSPEINDAWTLGHIHARHDAFLQSAPSAANLFDDAAARPTATGREVLQLQASGYAPVRQDAPNAVGVPPVVFASADPVRAKNARIGDTLSIADPRTAVTAFPNI